MPKQYRSIDQIKMKAMKDDAFFSDLWRNRENLRDFLGDGLSDKELDELQSLLEYGRGCVTAEEYLRDKKRRKKLDTGGKGVWA